MVRNNLSNIFSDLNSETPILQKSIKIKIKNSVNTISNTTSSFMSQNGGYLDATSSFMPQNEGYLDTTSSFMPQNEGYLDATSSFMPQKGGYLNATKNKDTDINQLISMLSTTSENNYITNYTDNNITDNNTDTEHLRNKLFDIIQDGGGAEDFQYGTPEDKRRIEIENKLKMIIEALEKEKKKKNYNIATDNINSNIYIDEDEDELNYANKVELINMLKLVIDEYAKIMSRDNTKSLFLNTMYKEGDGKPDKFY